MPAPNTLPEDATKEDIDSYVEQIAADVEEERKGEEPEKDDAQITTEHADNEKKPAAETDSGGDSADDEWDNVPSEDSEDSGEEETVDWRADAKAEAAAYGIGEDELAEFQSREELDRALKLFSRQMDNERTKLKSGDEERGEDQKKEPETKSYRDADGSYKVQLDPDVYDDELVAEFNAMRDHYESRLEALEQRFSEADAQAAEERFDRSVDALEFSALFGKTGEESSDEMNRRKELFEQVTVEQEVLSRLGRKVDYNALVQRVARSLFPEEYDKRVIKNHTRKISRQTDKRQGGGATRPTDPPENPRDFADRLYREMEGT